MFVQMKVQSMKVKVYVSPEPQPPPPPLAPLVEDPPPAPYPPGNTFWPAVNFSKVAGGCLSHISINSWQKWKKCQKIEKFSNPTKVQWTNSKIQSCKMMSKVTKLVNTKMLLTSQNMAYKTQQKKKQSAWHSSFLLKTNWGKVEKGGEEEEKTFVSFC